MKNATNVIALSIKNGEQDENLTEISLGESMKLRNLALDHEGNGKVVLDSDYLDMLSALLLRIASK